MRQIRDLIALAAPTNLSVLVQGPTGAGKELVAAALHAMSGRRGALVAFNVCAIGDAMFEDALFGHVRGAFTGALNDAPGFLREADGGTAFFDEVSGLHHGLQAKLLRAIELGQFRPVGARADCRSDFRVVAATNECLGDLVDARRFRADLAHRLGGVLISVPPLAERCEDIILLVHHFLERSERPVRLSQSAVRLLSEQPWPGNVRELRQVIEWAAVLASHRTGTTIDAELISDILANRAPSWSGSANGSAGGESPMRNELAALLVRHAWDTQRAAEELGIHRATLYRRMRRLRLQPPGLGVRHRTA